MFLSNVIHDFLADVLPWIIGIIDIIGVLVIVIGLGYAVYCLFNHKNENIALGKTVCLGLDVVLCGEILRTIIVENIDELKFVALLVLIRTTMAVVARWKLKVEVDEEREGVAIVNSLKKKKTKNEDNK